MAEYETRPFPSAKELEAWLREAHGTAPGVWVKIAKNASGIST